MCLIGGGAQESQAGPGRRSAGRSQPQAVRQADGAAKGGEERGGAEAAAATGAAGAKGTE